MSPSLAAHRLLTPRRREALIVAMVLALHALLLWLPWPLPSAAAAPRPVRIALMPARVVTAPPPRLPASVIPPAAAPEPSRTSHPASFVIAPVRSAVESGQAPAPTLTSPPADASAPPGPNSVPMPSAAPVPAAAPTTAEAAVICPERPAASYPPLSRKLGEQGRTVVRFGVDEAGRITAAEISASSGSPRLDRAALRAVGGYHCRPGAATVSQTFDFVLEPASHP